MPLSDRGGLPAQFDNAIVGVAFSLKIEGTHTTYCTEQALRAQAPVVQIAIAALTLVGPYAIIRPGCVALTEMLYFPLLVPILCFKCMRRETTENASSTFKIRP